MSLCLLSLVVMSQVGVGLTTVDADDRFEIEVFRDIEFAKVDDVSLKLDLYRPVGAASPPLVV